MNVLLISNYAAPYRGNFIPALETIEKHYKAGEVFYLFPQDAARHAWMQEFREQHKVWLAPRQIFSKHIQWSLLYDLRKRVKDNHITLVHTHFIEGNINMYLLRCLTGVRFVANLHNHYIVSGRLGAVRKWLFKHTNDKVIGDSPSVTESAYSIGVARERVVTILNSIQFSRLDNSTPVGLPREGRQVVLMFGFPWYRKGVDVVAKAVRALNVGGTKVLLAIAQSGGVEQTKEGIQQAIGEVPEWVVFLPPTDRLADYYDAADVFVSAGREEGLSYSPIEAGYCSCGVLCSNIGGNPLDIPQTGIYDKEDVEGLIRCLQQELSLTADEKAERNCLQRNYVLSHYNVEDWAEEVIKTYEN